MKSSTHSPTSRSHWVIWLSLVALVILAASHARAGDLKLVFTPLWNDHAVQINHWIPDAEPAGRSISELRFLISRPAFQRKDGSWHVVRDAFACVDLASPDSSKTQVEGIQGEKFTAVRFDIGVPPIENGADLPELDSAHPLNPATCPLKIQNQPGYTFLSLKGLWRQNDGQLGNFDYQLKGDPYLARIELPVEIDGSHSTEIEIQFDAAVALQDFDVSRMSEVKSHAALTTFSFNLRKAFQIKGAKQTDASGTVIRLTQN